MFVSNFFYLLQSNLLRDLDGLECREVELVVELCGDYVLRSTGKRPEGLFESILLTFSTQPDNESILSLFRALLRVCNKYQQLGAPRFLDAFEETLKGDQVQLKALAALKLNQDIIDSVVTLMSASEDSMLRFVELLGRTKYFTLLVSIQPAEKREKFVNLVWQHIFSSCETAALLGSRALSFYAQLPELAKTAKLKEFLSNPSSKSFETVVPYDKAKGALENLFG